MATNNPKYPHVFEPMEMAGRVLPNRICLTATLTNFGTGSRVTPRWQHFLIERAAGGTGLVVSEGIAVDPNAVAHPAVVAGFDPINEKGFEETAKGVHGSGAAIVAQLWHAGRQQLWSPTHSPQGVSDQPDAYSWSVPHVMDHAEVERVIQSFVDVAARFHQCGFDGVELHGAHGYLITQFMSPWSNTRDDQWGGNREGRLRFVREIATGIRAQCGDEFIIGLKLPGDEGVPGGIDPDESRQITQSLSATQLFNYFAYSQGNFSLSLENHVPDMHFNPGHFLDIAASMRAPAGDVPVMALGRIGSVAQADQVLADNPVDLVGMSRALVADAALVNKARANHVDPTRPCLFDNYQWGVIHTGKAMVECHNPLLAQPGEANWQPVKSQASLKVAVVGAGPCGLETAWIAAARGHTVSLIGSSAAPGGSLALEAQLKGHNIMGDLIDYQMRLCERYGVQLTLGQRAKAPMLGQFDKVVLCTGSHLRVPDYLSENAALRTDEKNLSIRQLVERFTSGSLVPGRTAVLLDMDHGASVYAVALELKARFEHVILVTPRAHIAQNVNYCSALGIHRRLHRAEIEIVTSHQVIERTSDGVTLSNVFSDKLSHIDDVDLLTYATPRRVNTLEMPAAGDQPILAGDCVSPRNLMIAIHEAHAVANAL